MLRCVAGVVYVEPFREIRPGAVCRCRGRSQSGHHDGSPGPGHFNSSGSRHASAPGRRGQLPVRAEGRDPLGQPLVLSHRPRHQTSMLVSPGGERHGRRQVRARRAASFGSSRNLGPAASAEEPASPQQRTITRKSIADARAEWVSQQPRAEPNPPARVERTAAAAAPHRSCRIARAQPCRTCWRRRRCRRCDGTTLPPRRALQSIPTDLQVAAANPPAAQPPQAEEVQQPAVDQIAPIAAADAPPAKPTASLQKLLLVMAAALALAGLTVSAIVRIGRMRARRAIRRKRRAMWDSAKTKRRSPQPMFHDEDAGLRRTGGVYQSARTPGPDTRAPRAYTRASRACHAHRKSGRAYLKSGRRACRKSGHARPRNGDTCPRIACPRIACPMIGSGSCRLRKCCPGSPAARRPDRNGSGGYFSSWRCSLRTNSVRPVRRSRLSRSALRIDCTSANASSTLWLTTI